MYFRLNTIFDLGRSFLGFLGSNDKSNSSSLELSCGGLVTILDLPKGAFIGTGVQTVVLFFEKGKPTKDIWYYQLNLDRNLGKTNSLNEKDLQELIELSKKQSEGNNSWLVKIKDINKVTYDLGVKNPNRKEVIDNRSPKEILTQIEKLDSESATIIAAIKKELM